MKQTAVEWLVDEFKQKLMGDNLPDWVLGIIEQAKQMEKEQIIDAHKTATLEAGFEYSADDWANQYYNQTYKPDDQKQTS